MEIDILGLCKLAFLELNEKELREHRVEYYERLEEDEKCYWKSPWWAVVYPTVS